MKFYAHHLRDLFWLVNTFYLDHGSHNLQHGTTGVFLFEQRLSRRLMLDQAQHTTLYINLNLGAHHQRGIRGKDLLLNAVLGAHCSVAEAGSGAVVPGVLGHSLPRHAGCTSSPRPLAESACVSVLSLLLLSRAAWKVRPEEASGRLESCSPASFQWGLWRPLAEIAASLRFSGGVMGRGQTMAFSRPTLAPS